MITVEEAAERGRRDRAKGKRSIFNPYRLLPPCQNRKDLIKAWDRGFSEDNG